MAKISTCIRNNKLLGQRLGGSTNTQYNLGAVTVPKYSQSNIDQYFTHGGPGKYADECFTYYFSKDTYVTAVSMFRGTGSDDFIVGIVMTLSNGENLVYGEVQGESSKSFTFNNDVRFVGYQAVTQKMNDADPQNIVPGNIESLKLISYSIDNC
jgi:hypothetical protein